MGERNKMNAHDSAVMNQIGVFQDAAQVKRLENGNAATLKRISQVVRVVKGQAWISLDGEDMVLKNGQEVYLRQGKQPAVISSVNRETLVYEIR
ncbi:MAG: DUF2917 domain-containing protein [Chloroflexi bacterium]|nr:DUF2917 domain-containing protein [Chloroflexota bacterium]MDL1882388.1 DUF2917 domain-containing protein [Anaerolineae bacterium CFX8]GIL11649.1 MAG: hypothetical protein BroJett038_03690 [Chloroflexota bacterium]